MQVSLNQSPQYRCQCPPRKAAPSFGCVDSKAAKETLKVVLSAKDVVKFQELVEGQKANKLVDVILFGRGKKLDANVSDNLQEVKLPGGVTRIKNYSQRLFESPISFIKRMCADATKRAEEVKGLMDKNNIIDSL